MNSTLRRLEQWYASNCNGDWQEVYGVRIDTLDNPGWSVEIDVVGTELANRAFDLFEDNYDDETDWLRCWVADGRFLAACGPERLEDALSVFLDWAHVKESPRQAE